MIKSTKFPKLTAATLGISLALGSLATAAVTSTAARAETKAAKTSSWIKNCRKLKDGSVDCITAINIIVTKPRKARLAGVAILSQGQTKKNVLLTVLPLGSQLQYGYTLKIDKNEPVKGNFSVCLRDGCHSQIEKSADIIKQMKKGKEMNLIYVNYKRQKINVAIPLTGFAKALKSKVTPKS